MKTVYLCAAKSISVVKCTELNYTANKCQHEHSQSVDLRQGEHLFRVRSPYPDSGLRTSDHWQHLTGLPCPRYISISIDLSQTVENAPSRNVEESF